MTGYKKKVFECINLTIILFETRIQKLSNNNNLIWNVQEGSII